MLVKRERNKLKLHKNNKNNKDKDKNNKSYINKKRIIRKLLIIIMEINEKKLPATNFIK